jgi:hypothetical protein
MTTQTPPTPSAPTIEKISSSPNYPNLDAFNFYNKATDILASIKSDSHVSLNEISVYDLLARDVIELSLLKAQRAQELSEKIKKGQDVYKRMTTHKKSLFNVKN